MVEGAASAPVHEAAEYVLYLMSLTGTASVVVVVVVADTTTSAIVAMAVAVSHRVSIIVFVGGRLSSVVYRV